MDENKKNIINQYNDLKKDFEEYKKRNDEIINSYHDIFSMLILDHELYSRGILNKLHNICYEILDFVVNVCDKYNLNYWLDGGTLLGAVRHNALIPWDDEIDIGMCRKDFNKFLEIIEGEIEENDLTGIIHVRSDMLATETWVMSYIQLPIWPEPGMYLTHIDIFPYDFISEIKDDTIELYEKEKYDFHIKLKNGVPRESVERDYFERLNLSHDYQKYLIPGVEAGRGEKDVSNFAILDSNEIFPLSNVKFGGKFYSCPKNNDYYLKGYWEDYMELPKFIDNHGKLSEMKKIPNSKEYYQKYIDLLHNINKNYPVDIGFKSGSIVQLPEGFSRYKISNHSVVIFDEDSSYTIHEFHDKSIKYIFNEYKIQHKDDVVYINSSDICNLTVFSLSLEINGKFIHTNYFFEKEGITYQIYHEGIFNSNIFEQLISSTKKIV